MRQQTYANQKITEEKWYIGTANTAVAGEEEAGRHKVWQKAIYKACRNMLHRDGKEEEVCTNETDTWCTGGTRVHQRTAYTR